MSHSVYFKRTNKLLLSSSLAACLCFDIYMYTLTLKPLLVHVPYLINDSLCGLLSPYMIFSLQFLLTSSFWIMCYGNILRYLSWNYETYMYISHALLNCCLFSLQDEFFSIQQTVTMLSYLLIAIGAAVDVLTLVYIFIKWRQSRAPKVCLFGNNFFKGWLSCTVLHCGSLRP